MTARRIYVAGPNGFTAAGQLWHNQVVLPQLMAAGLEPLDPWSGPADSWFNEACALEDPAARTAALRDVNVRVGKRNAELIADCDAMLANLEGPDVDSGTAAEIGYATALGKPVVAFRPDMRTTGDNSATLVNLQVEYFIAASKGTITDSLASAITALKTATA